MKRWTWVVLGGAAVGVVLAIISHQLLKSPDKSVSGHAPADPREVAVNKLKKELESDKAKQPSAETLKEMQDLAALPGGQQAALTFYDLWLRRMHGKKLGDTPDFRDLTLAWLAIEANAPARTVAALRQAPSQTEREYQSHLLHVFGNAALTPLSTAFVEDAIKAGDDFQTAAKSPFPQLLADLGAEALPSVVKFLKGDDVAVRRQALRTLALMVPEQAAEELPAIVATLSDKEPSVRAFAALVLGGELMRKDRPPDPALLKLLSDEDPFVRLAAARTLSRLDNVEKSRVASVVTALLKDNPFGDPTDLTSAQKRKMWWDIQGIDEFAIWKGGVNTGAYNALFWEETAAHVLLGLGPANRLTPEVIVQLLRSCRHDGRHLATLLAAQGDRARAAVPELAKMVKDSDSMQRRRALITLGRLGDPIAAAAVPDILAALDHEDGRTRWQAFLALMRIDTGAARSKLPDTLQGAINAAAGTLKRTDLTRVSVWTRSLWHDCAAIAVPVTDENMGVDALGLFRTPTDWDVIAENDRIDNMLSTLAAAAPPPSGDVGPLGKEAMPFLLSIWEGTSRNPVTRARHGNRALAIIAREGSAAELAVPHLILALNYYDDAGGEELAKAIVKIGPVSLPYLAAVLDDSKKSIYHLKVLEVLQHFGNKAQPAIPAIVRALSSPSEEISSKAADTFRFLRTAGKDAVPDLRYLLRSTDSKSALPFVGARSIALGSLQGVGPLLSASAFIPSTTSKTRRHAADALGNIGPEARPALPDLIELFRGENQEMRVVAVRAISGIGKDAVVPLTKAFDDPQEIVRLSAIQSLNRMPTEVARPALDATQKLVASETTPTVKEAATEFLRNLEAK